MVFNQSFVAKEPVNVVACVELVLKYATSFALYYTQCCMT